MWSDVSSCSLHQEELRLENAQGSPQSGTSGSVPTVKHGEGFVMVCVALSWYSVLLVPLLPHMAELLQGSTWTGLAIRYIPRSRRYFRTAMRFSKTTVAPFTQLDLFSLWFEEHEGEL
jgi:hypothetical protein